MKYTPREAVNPNVDSRPPSGHIWILLRLSAIVVIGYFALMLVFGWLGRHVPLSVEVRLLRPVSNLFLSAGLSLDDPKAKIAHAIFKKLKAASVLSDADLDFRLVKSTEENAYAVPGGIVVLNTELLEQARSENEVAMVIGHELGHVANRDVVASLGRVAMILGSALISSSGDSSAELLSSGNFMQLAYNRSQESAADEFGIRLLAEAYGTTVGAADFFQRHIEADKEGDIFGRSHPLSGDRVRRINEIASELGKGRGDVKRLELN